LALPSERAVNLSGPDGVWALTPVSGESLLGV